MARSSAAQNPALMLDGLPPERDAVFGVPSISARGVIHLVVIDLSTQIGKGCFHVIFT